MHSTGTVLLLLSCVAAITWAMSREWYKNKYCDTIAKLENKIKKFDTPSCDKYSPKIKNLKGKKNAK